MKMNIDTLYAIENIIDKRTQKGANDISIINYLERLKTIWKHDITILDGFISAIKQTPLIKGEENEKYGR